MLSAAGELVTVLVGEGDQPGDQGGDQGGNQAGDQGGDQAGDQRGDQGATHELGTLLAEHLRRTHPEVEVVCYRGGPPGRPVQLGVE
jgi:hypothetical protein